MTPEAVRQRGARPAPARRRRRGVVATGVLLSVVALGALGATGPAGAQTTPTTVPPDRLSGGGRLTLASQDPWTTVGGDTRLGLGVVDPPAGATLSFVIGPAITSRKEYDAAALGAPITSVLGQVSVPLDALAVEASGTRTVSLGLQSPTGPVDRQRLNARRPGVYPLQVELRDAQEQSVGSFRTMLMVADPDRPTVAQRLGVAWVWPVTAPPSFLPSGVRDRDVLAAMRSGGRLGRMALALDAAPDVPVTLAPTAETVEAWAEAARTDPNLATTFAALQRAAGVRAVTSGPYVPVDLPALVDHGLAEAADDGASRGREVLDPALGVTTDARTRLVRPASTGALIRLASGGVDRVIVDSRDLATAPETRLTPAQPVTLAMSTEPDGPKATALVTDPTLQGLLSAELPAAQRAQLVLAGLAMTALEAPALERVVTVANPDDFDPPPGLYEALLAGLRGNPFLRPVTTTQAFDSVPTDPPAPTVNAGLATSRRNLANGATAEPAISPSAYQAQRTRVRSFAALAQPDDPTVIAAQRALLASVATGWPADIGRARASAHLAAVGRAIDTLIAQIEVPDPRAITLTSRSGQIPLTFRNETGFPVRLRASLASDKLFFPKGSVFDLELPPKSTTVRVAVKARTSGTFPVDLEVTSTDGVLSISQRRLEVRSTFVSTVGLVLTASAVTVLALWWGIDLRRRRSRRRSSTTT